MQLSTIFIVLCYSTFVFTLPLVSVRRHALPSPLDSGEKAVASGATLTGRSVISESDVSPLPTKEAAVLRKRNGVSMAVDLGKLIATGVQEVQHKKAENKEDKKKFLEEEVKKAHIEHPDGYVIGIHPDHRWEPKEKCPWGHKVVYFNNHDLTANKRVKFTIYWTTGAKLTSKGPTGSENWFFTGPAEASPGVPGIDMKGLTVTFNEIKKKS